MAVDASSIDIALGPEPLTDVYHVVQPHETPWPLILSALERAGLSFRRVAPAEWLGAVEASYKGREADGGSAMLDMWKRAVSTIIFGSVLGARRSALGEAPAGDSRLLGPWTCPTILLGGALQR